LRTVALLDAIGHPNDRRGSSFAAIDAVEATGQSIHRLAFRRFSS